MYEKAPEKVLANEELLQRTLFGDKPYAEVVLATDGPNKDGEAIGMALFVCIRTHYYHTSSPLTDVNTMSNSCETEHGIYISERA